MRVLIAAARGPIRALAKAASDSSEADIYAIVSSLSALLTDLQTNDSDVLLVDFDLPDLGGLKGLSLIRTATETPLGICMVGASLELFRRAVSNGAQALLPREMTLSELQAAVTLIASGRHVAVTPTNTPPDSRQRANQLSERELQVLTGLCQGLQNKEIAHAFEVQEVTVKMHVRSIIRKLGAHNRTHAAMIARDLGIC